MKRSASAQMNKAFTSAIQKQFISISEAYELLAMYFVNADVIASWTKLLQLKHENFETYLNGKERLNFMADIVSEYSQLRERLDPTSRLLLGGSSPMLPMEKTYWNMVFPDILICNLKKSGTYGCIYGNPRSGKTSLAVNFIELFINTSQLHILTNIVLKEDLEQVHFCPTLSELVKQMATQNGWICILDETATFVGKKRALSKENVDFENLGRFVGKLGGRLLMITHDMARDVPPILQSWMTETYKKLDLTEMIAIMRRTGGFQLNRVISNIPDCTLSFVTEDITSLNFDISIKDLLNDIQTMKGVEKGEQKNAILEWLENNRKRSKEEPTDIAERRAKLAEEKVDALLEKGWSKMKAYIKIGRNMGLSPQTIRYYYSFRKREKKDAEGGGMNDFDGQSMDTSTSLGEEDSETEGEVS